ncbi:polysaccharide biosynthesis/export family protein [Candidatus Laterigemmans baculatus]|uniref:polysaccharide biosynthesis/export family protein n=1 Tax=Candidatus Laterigemmans baculatus TaxID=2770505 RepID=UPI0013D93D75|nr:polysaccharide biosynthesis/export family protein [Candidatus Laterigemmans baculatus]
MQCQDAGLGVEASPLATQGSVSQYSLQGSTGMQSPKYTVRQRSIRNLWLGKGLQPWRTQLFLLPLLCGVALSGGCWAPLHSPGIPASTLPDSFRVPVRTAGMPLNFANLTAQPPADYLLGPGDVLRVTIPDLFPQSETQPLEVQVMASGEVHLPLVGAVRVGNGNLMQAQRVITEAYADGYLKEPRINVALAQKTTIDVLVLGEVASPGVHPLPKYQNDVGHALAAAGGLGEDADAVIEIHRRTPDSEFAPPLEREGLDIYECNPKDPKKILRIPLRGLMPGAIDQSDVVLNPGDVVLVPSRKHEVFFVVGRLSTTNLVRFTLGDRERELGAGLILPRDRDIDVVTAVTMAGYIDPIESPTTVTVHRTMPDGRPMLILVDLIAARYDPRETVLVEPGDIIYLNPDSAWYFRRLFDRLVDDLLIIPYARWAGPRN